MTNYEERIADLEAQMAGMVVRHSALEWFVEQHLSNYWLQRGQLQGETWLDQVSHPSRAAYYKDGGAELPVIPEGQAAISEAIAHIGSKILTRLRQGVIRG